QRLRELDDIGAKKVYVRAPSSEGVGLAVYNRLIRAAGFEVIRI
ncbi:MAG: translation factor SUA5, partial [Ruminococcus sp.]|nr:translation factor SUA5 [Ruminococcus sp.]